VSHRVAALLAALALALGALAVAAASASPVRISSGFEHGLGGFNLGGVGDVYPKIIRVGHGHDKVCRFILDGDEERSELSLGGDGTAESDGTIRFGEGAEYWYAFSFDLREVAWGRPGAHNLIMQFRPNGEGTPNMALGLWDYKGSRGLWTEGNAMGGNRFLAPLTLHAWHRVEIHFRASGRGRGFYQVYLDGKLVDGRSGVNTIVPGKAYGFIKDGLYRNGEAIQGKSVLLLDSVELSTQRPG
jgi:hypothetical protein